MISRRSFFTGALAAAAVSKPASSWANNSAIEDWQTKLVEAARSQIGVTMIYDPAYVGLSCPNGDIPRHKGVCSDVVIRAYRDAFGFDLQQAVHQDMKKNFSKYPTYWGLKRPDKNIDHRRVLNLETYFSRFGEEINLSAEKSDFQPGDLITQRLPGNLPHIVILSDQFANSKTHPLAIHNVGQGTQEQDVLFLWPKIRHFRFNPELI